MVDIEAVKQRNPIAEVVSRYGVELRRNGGRLGGRCPFHEDRSPSLVVYPETRSFYCFGCGAGGDVIDFVRRAEGLGFREALLRLDGAPTEAPRQVRRPRAAPTRLSLDDRIILAAAFELYHETLARTLDALRYLHDRGVTERIARRCRLGYADGAQLVPYLSRRRLSLRRAREIGLLTADGREALAGRLVVPELRGGRCTWLVGRALDYGQQPKYRGLALPRPLLGWELVRDRSRVFVTEGPFDWLTLVGWGLPACALLGTQAGQGTLRLLDRARSIVLVLDGDAPGIEAADNLAAALGERALVVRLPEGVKDVNELGVRPDGRATFFELLDAMTRSEPPAIRTASARTRPRSLRGRTSAGLLRSARWRNERDPLAGVLAAAAPRDGERLVLRLVVGPAPWRAADRIRRRSDPDRRTQREDDRSPAPGVLPLVALLSVGAAAMQGWRWYLAGEWSLLAAGGAGAFVGLPLIGALALRVLRRPEPLASRVVEQKLAAPLFGAHLEVRAFGESGVDKHRLDALASQAAAAYGAYNDPAGGGLRPGRPTLVQRGRRRRLPLQLNSAELAALWHLPEQAGAPAGIRRTTAQRLAPAPGHALRGARVGVADGGSSAAAVYLPAPLLHRNQLIVAKTRRGKSTLLRHLAAGVMERVASGADETALVVVDPHQDLADAVLDAVPDALADRTIYLDFANLERPIGLNLIDVALFPDRDRTTEHVVTMLNRLWPANWGPRMEGALRAALACLLEANTQRERDAQFTLLDVAPLLTDAKLREDLLRQVQDPALRAWWRDNYDRAGRVLQQQTANPVTSKIGRFTVTEASRLVLGQARSTFDPRALLRDGGVLVVNTAVGALGEGAASLVGATLLNLLGLIVEEQVLLPAARRRRVVGLIDESSTLGAVDYPRMLSELGKYGASFVLVTQSLAKLDAIDRNLAPTIFANSDGLTVFQVSAEDARKLTPELGSGIEVEDLVSLDDFACYARWWDGRARPPAFSFRVDPPPATVPGRAQAIAQRSASRHGRPRDAVVEEITRVLSERSPADSTGSRERKSQGELKEAADASAAESGAPTKPTGKAEQPESAHAGKADRRGNKQRPTGQSGQAKQ